MEENKRELNPNEMQNADINVGVAWEPEFICPECGFKTTDHQEFEAHRDEHLAADRRFPSHVLPWHP